MYLCLLHRALLQNLLHDVFLIARAELVLENAVRGAVEDALTALPIHTNTLASKISPLHCNKIRCIHRIICIELIVDDERELGKNLLVRDEDLPPVHDLRQRHRLIVLPVPNCLYAVDEDHEVVLGALVVHLGLRVVSARHDGCSCW